MAFPFSFKRFGLALTAGVLLCGAACAQDKAAAAAVGAAPTTTSDAVKIAWLEKMVKYLQTELTALKEKQRLAERQSTSGGKAGAPTLASLDQKVTELQKKLENHTHEYLLEGRASDGTIQAMPQDRFPGSGLNSTGGARVGRAIIR